MTETQTQLKNVTKELVDLRKENELLKEQNRKLAELEEKIRVLTDSLEEEMSRRSSQPPSRSQPTPPLIHLEEIIPEDGSIESLLNEITTLKSHLANKEQLEHELCKELISLKSCTETQEFKCKRLISACIGLPLEHIDTLLDPLLRAIESDDPVDLLDPQHISLFMNRFKEPDGLYK